MAHHRPESKGPQEDFEFVARCLLITIERLDEMALNLENLRAAVQKLGTDIPAAIAAAAAGAGDAANQVAIDAITAQLEALDATIAAAAPAPAAPAAA